jgi:hypothetical protein
MPRGKLMYPQSNPSARIKPGYDCGSIETLSTTLAPRVFDLLEIYVLVDIKKVSIVADAIENKVLFMIDTVKTGFSKTSK